MLSKCQIFIIFAHNNYYFAHEKIIYSYCYLLFYNALQLYEIN